MDVVDGREQVAGPPTRIVVNRASGSSRDVFTPIRRWIAVPTASASKAVGVGSGGTGHPAVPRAIASIRSARRQGLTGGQGKDQRGDGIRRAGPAEAASSRRHRRSGRIVEQQVRRHHERVGVEGLVRHDAGGAGVGERRRVRALVGARVRVRDDDRRDPERGDLGQGRRARTADDEIGRDEGREHVLAQERVRPIAVAQLGGQPLAARRARRRSRCRP